MEWENLDEALPNEITKYDQGQIARLRNQLTHHSNYYRKELTVTNKASCAMLKEIVGKWHFCPGTDKTQFSANNDAFFAGKF